MSSTLHNALKLADKRQVRILICGDGYLGTHLLSYLLACGEFAERLPAVFKRPSVQSLSLSRLQSLQGYLRKREPYCIVNVSGAASVEDSFLDPDRHANEPSELINFHGQVSGIGCNYIYVSSAAVYGETTAVGATETDDLRPESPYGAGKLSAERTAQRLLADGHFRHLTIHRPFSVYSIDLRKRLLYALVQSIRGQRQILLDGSGTETRDFIHISDFCESIRASLAEQNLSSLSIRNVGTGIRTSVNEVAEIAAEEWWRSHHTRIPITFTGKHRRGDPRNLVSREASIANLRVLPQEGVRQYFRWHFSSDR